MTVIMQWEKDMSSVKLLGGLSGCEVILEKDATVTKITNSNEYNERLINQGNKQSLFSKFILKNIDTPKVLEIGENFIRMEYVEAKNFNDFLKYATNKDIFFITDSLCGYIEFLKNRSRPSNVNTNLVIRRKVESLRDKTKHINVIDRLLSKLDSLNSNEIPHTFCHGDLTFSNILFHKNRLYFIDFLDTFMDSYILDLVKLKQDLFYNWSSKTQRINNIRIHQSKRYIWEKIYNNNKEIIESEWFDFFNILNILRIEPYIQNDIQRNVLDNIVEEFKL